MLWPRLKRWKLELSSRRLSSGGGNGLRGLLFWCLPFGKYRMDHQLHAAFHMVQLQCVEREVTGRINDAPFGSHVSSGSRKGCAVT